MSAEPKWRVVADLIVPHPTEAQILVHHANGQWRLPNALRGAGWPSVIARLTTGLREQLGLETIVIREVSEHSDEAQRLAHSLYLMEIQNKAWTPPANLRWLGATELDQLVLAHPEQRALLQAHFQEQASGLIPERRVAWERPGWYRPATAWVQQQLAQLGLPATGPVEQVKNWCLSSILRVPTAQGLVYFKASNGSALMVNEAVVTQALARFFPANMPQPLAIDAAQDWMLLADFGGEIGWDASVETREAALVAFAQLQLASVARVDELLAAGSIDRRLPRLVEQIEPLLNDPAILRLLEPEQRQALLALAPRLTALCEQMAEYKVPAALVHGDLHMSNVAQREEQFVFFDWSDACIAHPFLDTISILHEKDPAVQARLRAAYLATWTAYEPAERLLELWQLAYPICALHQAVSYRFIGQHIEGGYNHSMSKWAIPYWFGKIFEAFER